MPTRDDFRAWKSGHAAQKKASPVSAGKLAQATWRARSVSPADGASQVGAEAKEGLVPWLGRAELSIGRVGGLAEECVVGIAIERAPGRIEVVLAENARSFEICLEPARLGA